MRSANGLETVGRELGARAARGGFPGAKRAVGLLDQLLELGPAIAYSALLSAQRRERTLEVQDDAPLGAKRLAVAL